MSGIRVILVDDHPFYREGVRAMIADQPGIELVGEAATGEAAIALAADTRPDVVIMDVAMPGMGGIEATRRITSTRPETAVLILTMHDDATVFTALHAGARGYLLKDAGVDELLRAILAVHRGEAIFSPAAATRIAHHFAHGPAAAGPGRFPDLTDRETEVLALLADDLGTAAIARRLGLTEKTVYNYVATILAKLRARDRAEAAARARAAGLGGR